MVNFLILIARFRAFKRFFRVIILPNRIAFYKPLFLNWLDHFVFEVFLVWTGKYITSRLKIRFERRWFAKMAIIRVFYPRITPDVYTMYRFGQLLGFLWGVVIFGYSYIYIMCKPF
jgi:hypothetical protein